MTVVSVTISGLGVVAAAPAGAGIVAAGTGEAAGTTSEVAGTTGALSNVGTTG